MQFFHLHSSHVLKRPTSTEEGERLALEINLQRLQNQNQVMFHLLQKKVLITAYIDNQTLWQNFMISTATNLPKIMHRCHEKIPH